MRRRLALLALLFGLSGCGGGESAGAETGGGGVEVLPELELWGYLRTGTTGLATEAPLGPLGFDAIRQSTDKSHALIHVSGFT